MVSVNDTIILFYKIKRKNVPKPLDIVFKTAYTVYYNYLTGLENIMFQIIVDSAANIPAELVKNIRSKFFLLSTL